MISGRSGRIRTCDPRVPNAVLYQTEPHSDLRGGLIEEPKGCAQACGRIGRVARRPDGLGERAVARAPFPRYLSALARTGRPRRPQSVGEWCNGNTAVFGTVILGSSPSSPANGPE